jgi:hypothetical protein
MRTDAALGWGLVMRLAPLLALCIALASIPARAQDAAGRFNHFIDFRARPGAMWGHTFILYGRVDERGRPVELVHAGLYPDDGQVGLIFGTLVPVRAKVRAVHGDFSETPSAIYRRPLSPAQYARLKATVAYLRANDRSWHMLTHNCNDFGREVAQSLGLYTPPGILVPNAWVRALKAMNER